MLQMKIQASGAEIDFEIEDAQGSQGRFRLGRQATAVLILQAYQEMGKLPPLRNLRSELLHQDTQPPFLRGYPAMELAIAKGGDIVLALRLSPFPTIEYLIDDYQASILASDLAELIDTPRDQRLALTFSGSKKVPKH